MISLKDELFEKIEKKTSVNRDTIISLAKRLQNGNYKDKSILKSIIKDISKITGKEVSTDKEDKIIDAIINDKVPSDVDKYV